MNSGLIFEQNKQEPKTSCALVPQSSSRAVWVRAFEPTASTLTFSYVCSGDRVQQPALGERLAGVLCCARAVVVPCRLLVERPSCLRCHLLRMVTVLVLRCSKLFESVEEYSNQMVSSWAVFWEETRCLSYDRLAMRLKKRDKGVSPADFHP